MKERMIRVKKIGIVMLGAVFLCFAGCGSGSKSDTVMQESSAASSADSYASDNIYENQESMEEAVEEEMAEGEAGDVAANRKLIKNVSMSVETEEFDTLISAVENKTESLGGYIENMDLYNGSSFYGETHRNAYLTIRIPKEKLDAFVSEVAQVSNVVSRNENTQDVTMQYVDLESRKKALEIEQERLLVLLEQAESIEDIVALESRLSEVRYELDSMESQLRTYDNLVDYATVTLDISEVERLTPVEEVSAGERMADGFVQSVHNLFGGLKDFGIGLIICLPYLLFWGLIIFALLLLVRRFKKKRAGRKMAKLQNMGAYPQNIQPNVSQDVQPNGQINENGKEEK